MTADQKFPQETVDKLINGVCKKCEWCKTMKQYHFCPYPWGLTKDFSECTSFQKSKYWEKKDRESELASLRSEMMQKGIMPKYIIGQNVYFPASWDHHCVEHQIVRDCIPMGDYWIYKVSGYNNTINEHSLHPTEQECMQHIMDDFVNEIREEALRIAKDARRYGMAIGGADIKFLESSKNNEENH